MHTSTLLLALAAFVLRCVHAELHSDGVCFDNVGGQNVYNGAATTAACASYLQRNTGGEQWDSCPDCAIKLVGNLSVCHSDAWHIGGDELNHYCEKHGAGGSMAN
ncbi:hypothetical protein IQ06DRAFT_40266 [Phaeosphaeriaceae sp. SRC1lsM3a]|nr:hypothetical protein IQ06DRAFT_40266 [Stagonospora sp. SRC1lsM3a]